MPQYIKPAISGLNTDHALYDDIQAFLEFGQLDKELVGDTALTTTAALVDDTDIGDARTFDATADAVAETVTITGDCTILVIARMIGSHSIGSNGNVFFALGGTGGDFVYLMYDDFSPYKFQSGNRANYTPGATLRTNGDGLDATAHAQGHTIAATLDLNGTNKLCRDGVIATETSSMTGTAYAASPILSFMSSIGSSASVNVGAIVVFDRALSDAELQSVTSDPWALTAEANSDPVLDTPQDDLTIQEGQTGTINAGANFSDANAGDTLTFSINPNIDSVTGFSFNTETGTITYDGSQSSSNSVSYTITCSDGNGGTDATDTFDITVTAPSMSIEGSTNLTPTIGETVTLTLANTTNSTGKILSCPAGFITATSEDANSITFVTPDPRTFGTRVLPFEENITFSVADGSDLDAITLTIKKPTGYDLVDVTSVGGIYLDDTTVEVGDTALGHFVTGKGTTFLAEGLIIPSTQCSYEYWVKDASDGVWSTSAIETFEDPARTEVTVTSPDLTEGSVFFNYTGPTPVDNGLILYDDTTQPSGIGVTILPSGVWQLSEFSPVEETFTAYYVSPDGDIGEVATFTYTSPSFVVGSPNNDNPTTGDVVTIPVNGVGTYTSTYNGQSFSITSQTASQLTYNWPDITTFGDSTLLFNTAYDLVVTDTDDSETGTVSITTTVPNGYVYGQVASKTVGGIYENDIDITVGDYVLLQVTSGNTVVDVTTGETTDSLPSTVEYKRYSTSWNAFKTANVDGYPIPVITSNPTAGAVTYGDNTSTKTYSVVATDDSGNITYQWEYSDDNGNTYLDVTGATSANYTVNGSSYPNDSLSGRLYRCKVSNVGGTVTSSAASLVLIAPNLPTIVVQPSGGSVQAGNGTSQYTFNISATAALTYQWEISDNDGVSYADVVGAESSSLLVTGDQFTDTVLDGRRYRCKATNNVGTVTSNYATLTITPSSTLAPTLSDPTGTPTGATTATATVITTEGNGTLYFFASTNQVENEATIKANGSQAVTATGAQAVNLTGLTPTTSYYVHFIHVDSDLNDSNTIVTNVFATDANDPVINNIDNDNDVYPGQVCTIYGANFGNSSGSVTLGGVPQLVGAWTDTEITITVVKGTMDYANDHQLVVTLP